MAAQEAPMGKYRWLDAMSVGIDEFDTDHGKFFATLYALDDALMNEDRDKALTLSDDLLALMQDHMQREIDYLRQCNYPGLDKILEAQTQSSAAVEKLHYLVRHDPQGAMHAIFDMQSSLMNYLLDGDTNYKSFVEKHDKDGKRR